MRIVKGIVAGVTLAMVALAGLARADSAVVIAEDGGFDGPTLQTIRTLVSSELRTRGLTVREDPSFHGALVVDAALLDTAGSRGVDRLFVLRLGRLGSKVLVSLEEIAPPAPTPVYLSSLNAANIDESDTVIPRLVQAVLAREPVERTARIATVTEGESRPFRKKPGEGFWIVGLNVVPLGGSFGWSYEARNWRVGVLFHGAKDDPGYFGLEGAWIPLDGATSPYVSAGLGVVSSDNEAKLGSKVEVGVEFMRLHGVRVMVGGSAVIPFESIPGTDRFNPSLHIRLGF